jgi:cytochrome c oxidase assembly protein subunit 15
MNDERQQRNATPGSAPAVNRRASGADAAFAPPPWLHAYACFVAGSILVLICSGGLVTSKGVGLAVPDWPTTYGYNVFAFPISRWVGGVLYEHAHRLIASAVGFFTLGLTVWLCLAERRRWVRNLGIAALIAVIVQAVLGGLRVVELNAAFGLFHACLAQAFLALVALIAFVTSPWWFRLSRGDPGAGVSTLWILPKVFALVAILIYAQLGIGATMRHAHAGLSIPDFPTAYGQAWPQIDAARLAQINRQRDAVLHLPPTTLVQIQMQMGHRVMAGLILVTVLATAFLTWTRRALLPTGLLRLALAGPMLIICQITLGVETIWTNKAADVATAHVALGAVSLVWSVVTYAALRRWIAPVSPRPGAEVSQVHPRMEVGV